MRGFRRFIYFLYLEEKMGGTYRHSILKLKNTNRGILCSFCQVAGWDFLYLKSQKLYEDRPVRIPDVYAARFISSAVVYGFSGNVSISMYGVGYSVSFLVSIAYFTLLPP